MTVLADPHPPARRQRALFSFLILVAVLAVCSLFLGYQTRGFSDIASAIFSYDPTSADDVVLRDIRIPRIIGALLGGAALGASGALLQAMTRNPLADPGILGVNAGAAVGVVLSIIILGITNPAQYVWSALIGCAVTSTLVFLIGGSKNANPMRLLIAGATMMVVSLAAIRAILLLSRQTLDTYRFWVLGGLDGVTYDMLLALAPFLVAGAVLTVVCSFWLNALALGVEMARGLGLRVWLVQFTTLIAVVLLCGATVSMAGPIAFVGLISAHIARGFAGGEAKWLVLLSACLGAALLLGADLIGRLAIFGGNMQAGVMSAMIGGPVLIWMVRRQGLTRI